MRALPLVHLLAARIDRPGTVAHDHVVMWHAHRLDQRRTGQRRGARAVHHHPAFGHLAPGQVHGVDETRSGDDRGAVLVVMHHRNIHPLAQCLLDDEAFGRGDVFKVDAAEGRFHQSDGVDEGIRVFGIEFDIDRIDVGEAFEQHRLAFHHRLGSERAEIAHAQNGGAIRDHRDEVRACGIFRRVLRIVGDRLHRRSNARRIGERQVTLGRHRLGGDDFDLTRTDRLVIKQRLAGLES